MSPDIQSEELLKAIETAIPVTAIEQAIANTQTEEERKRSQKSAISGKSGNSNEFLV